MKKYFERFKNVGTIISLAALIGLLLVQFGVHIDTVWLDTTVKIICAVLVILGVCNNPTNSGIDLPVINKQTTEPINQDVETITKAQENLKKEQGIEQ